MPKTFHDPTKPLRSPPPTYLMYDPLLEIKNVWNVQYLQNMFLFV